MEQGFEQSRSFSMICRHKKALYSSSDNLQRRRRVKQGGQAKPGSSRKRLQGGFLPLYFLMRSHCKRKIIMTPKKVRMEEGSAGSGIERIEQKTLVLVPSGGISCSLAKKAKVVAQSLLLLHVGRYYCVDQSYFALLLARLSRFLSVVARLRTRTTVLSMNSGLKRNHTNHPFSQNPSSRSRQHSQIVHY